MTEHETKSSSNETKFHNDQIEVVVHKLPHCKAKFDISVSPAAVAASEVSAFKAVKKEVNIPGFRKGKAPDSFIKDKYAGAVKKEWEEIVLNTAFSEALDLTKISPLKNGSNFHTNLKEISLDKGAKITFEFEHYPDVPTIALDQLELKTIEAPAITEEDINNEIEQLQMRFAEFEPIEDRGLQKNDFMDITISVTEEGVTIDTVKNQRTQAVDKFFPHWLLTKAEGLKAGESVEGMTEYDQKSGEEQAKFKSVPYKLTINKLLKANLPALDDELAKKVSLTTFDELKEKIKERIEKDRQLAKEEKTFFELENLLTKQFDFEIPASFLKSSAEDYFAQYIQDFQKSNKECSAEDYKYLQNLAETRANRGLHLYLLYNKLAADHEIVPNEEDIAAELNYQLSLMMSGRSSIDFQDTQENLREKVEKLARDRKIKQFLIDHTRFS